METEEELDEIERPSLQLAVNDDIVELMELSQIDRESSDLSVLNSLRLFTTPEILSDSNAYICEKCCTSSKKVLFESFFKLKFQI